MPLSLIFTLLMFSNPIFLTVVATTLLILLLISVVIITMFLSNRRNVQQEIKMAQMQLDYEKGQREVQEQVMTDVARELHDNVGSRLTFIKTQLQQLKIVNPAMNEALLPVNEMMVLTMEEVRMLGRSLNSDHIDKNGLVYTIDREIERLRLLDKYKVHWQHDEEPALSKDQKVIVFRMFQEMLNNLLKHADASNIYISLSGKNRFKMGVSDDGKGFDMAEIMNSAKGAGLKNIIKRSELAQLKCKIESVVGEGTIISLEN